MKKCATCGYLSLKRTHTGEFDEFPGTLRKGGGSQEGRHLPFPFCYVDEYDLPGECFAIAKGRVGSEIMHEVVQRGREDCPRWTSWMQGFSPLQHIQMALDREQRSQDHRKWRIEVLGLGAGLIVVGVVGPLLAVVLDNCAFGGP